MRRLVVSTGLGRVALFAVLACVGTAFGQAPGSAERANAKVSLLSSVEALVPGVPFDIGLRFELDPGWHIYWKNSGDSGLPPDVTWEVPDGFDVGALAFPIPKQHVSPGNIVTNIHEGEPVLLARVRPPQTIGGSSVSLKGHVRYLICRENCVRAEADVRLDLPVRPAGSDVIEANAALFKKARNELPKATTKYLAVTARTSPERLNPGKRFALLVNVDIRPGYHVQSHEPSNPAFIPTSVFLDRVDGVFFDPPVYPKPTLRTVKFLGRLSEFKGSIQIRIPGEVDRGAVVDASQLRGLLKFQSCDDQGHCFPPDAVTFRVGGDPEIKTGSATGMGESPTGPVLNDSGASAVAATADQGLSDEQADLGATSGDELAGYLGRFGLVGLLFGCFLYGLFINATPCVLPLLSIKVLGFVQQAHESRGRTLGLGLAFGAGVMLFFVVLGFLASAGTNVLQFPAAVIGLGAVVMALGLSMLGVYTLQVPTAATKLDASIKKEGPLASFGKGALAPVLGFACTGPLLAGAFGWATQQPAHIAVLAFLFAGLGMASPYVLLGANPHWLSFLPKPGNWMITFERIMGFLLLAMVVWLLHPLTQQIGTEGLEWTMVFLVAIGMACWVFGQVKLSMSTAQRWAYRGGAVAFVVLAGGIIYEVIYPLDEAQAYASQTTTVTTHNGVNDWSDIPWQLCFADTAKVSLNVDGTCENADDAFCRVCRAVWDSAWEPGIPWQRWSRQDVEEAVRGGRTAFVDFTAAYCTQCKANKYVATNTPEVREKMKEFEVIPFQGDYTSGDDEIHSILAAFNRPGVPLNLIYPAGKPDEPIILPTVLSKSLLLEKLEEAGASKLASVATRAEQ